MAEFLIHDDNWDRFEKKMSTLRKKCKQSNCTFTCIELGIEYRECKSSDGETYIAKFHKVEVVGEAKYNGWRFVAVLDHHEEGNVIRAYDTELVVPDKYKTCGPTCEHCNKIRSRKDTYLIYNDETKEFKQVGKSCLQEFTNGLSAENVAFFCSIYDQADSYSSFSGSSFTRYIEVESILRYAFECFRNWGYQKSEGSIADQLGYLPAGYRSTRSRVTDYYFINRLRGKDKEKAQSEMREVHFDSNSEYATKSTEKALEWIRNMEPKSEYIRNLKIICSDEYTEHRNLGILVSLTAAYSKEIEAEQIKAKEVKVKAESEYVGEIKDKLQISTSDFNLVSAWDTLYGTTYLYKFTDESGNCFVWYASKHIDDADRVIQVSGTVKDHTEYKGTKQTILTRCKVTLSPEPVKEETSEPAESVEEAVSEFLDYCNA